MAEDGKVVFKYEGDTSGIDKANDDAEQKVKSGAKKIDNAASETGGKLSSLSSGIVSGIGMALGNGLISAAGGLLEFGKQGIEIASNLNEVQNVVDTTFGENSDKIDQFAKSAAANFGESELQAKQYTSTLGAMLKSSGLSSDATLQMSTSLAGLTGDFASFYNLDPADAFEKIRAGISGETEPLKQLGINMDVANLQAFALSQGITTSYQSMTQAQQETLRYNYLMSATKDAQGDFAKTSGSFANQQRILQMQMQSLSATVGGAFLPVLTDLMGTLTTGLADPAATNMIKGLATAIGSAVSGVLPVFLNLIKQVGPPLLQMAQEIIPVILNIIQQLLPFITQIVLQLLPPLMDIFTQLLPPLMMIVNALLPAILPIFQALLPPIAQLISALLPPIVSLLNAIIPIINLLAPLIAWLAGIIGDNLSGAFKIIGPIINDVIGVFTSLLSFIKDVFAGNWGAAWKDIQDMFGHYFGAIGGLVKAPINFIISGINAFIGGLDKLTIPDWVPGVGGMGINIPKIPMLARGGAAYGPTQAIIGDNPQASIDPEVVAPISRIQSLMEINVAEMGAGMAAAIKEAFAGQSINLQSAAAATTIVVQPATVQLNADARKIGLSVTESQWRDAATRRYR